MTRAWFSVLAVCAWSLTSCSGGSGGSSVTPRGPASHATGTAQFVINAPSATQTSAHGRRTPQYLSNATQSLSIAIAGPTDYSATVNLTVSSSGCTSTLATTICTLNVPGLQPCTSPPTNCYTATLTTYDQTNGGGNVLSGAQAVLFTITAGTTNTISISLSGAPVTTLVLPVGSFTQSNGTGGYDLIGLGAHKFVVETLDADNNIIAGPGAPTFSFGSTSGSLGVTVTQPTAGSPNEFSVTPPSSYSASTASFTVTPTFSGQQTNGCALTGANCGGASVTVDMKQMLAVANGGSPGNVELYELGSSSPVASISSSAVHNPTHLAADASGDLFIANWNGVNGSNVLEVGAGATAITQTIAASGFPVALAVEPVNQNLGILICNAGDVDSGGTLSSCGGTGSDALEIVAPPYSGAATTVTSGISYPMSLATDGSGNFYVANCASCATPPSADNVAEFTSSGSSVGTVLLLDECPCPGLYVDASSNIFVIQTAITDEIAKYPHSDVGAGPVSPSETITSDVGASSSSPIGLAGSGGNLFLDNYLGTGGSVVVYDGEGTTASDEITSGISGADSLAFDNAGDLWVSNVGASTSVTKYTAASWSLGSTLTTGVTSPQSIVVVP